MSGAPEACREVDRFLTAGSERSTSLGTDHHRLWNALAQATAGGKRFRPGLLMATYEALAPAGATGADDPTGTVASPASVARVGAALELLHTAFVVHDDVIDGDEMRRGTPNVSGIFAAAARDRGVGSVSSRRYGDAAGILAGDLALVSAVRMVAGCGAPAPMVTELLDLLENTVHATAAGELADVRLGLGMSQTPCTVDEAMRVAELKTAVYSFQLPLQAGALLAGASRQVTEALGEIGRPLGIGFQLLDDLLGVFGVSARTGKSVLTDLREGKETALMAHARTTATWPALRQLVGDRHLTGQGARRTRKLLEECGARSVTEDLADGHLNEALTRASRVPVPPALANVLTGLVAEIRRTATDSMLPSRPDPEQQDTAWLEPELAVLERQASVRPSASRMVPAGTGVGQ